MRAKPLSIKPSHGHLRNQTSVSAGADMSRSRTAFLVAPLAVPIIMAVRLYPVAMSSPSWFVVALCLSAIIAYAGTFVFGVPAYLWLRARKWTAFWIAPIVGFVAAALAYCAFIALFMLRTSLSDLPSRLSSVLHEVLWPYGPMGAAVGALLWLIARPDRAGS